jgi:hypothetical protein
MATWMEGKRMLEDGFTIQALRRTKHDELRRAACTARLALPKANQTGPVHLRTNVVWTHSTPWPPPEYHGAIEMLCRREMLE